MGAPRCPVSYFDCGILCRTASWLSRSRIWREWRLEVRAISVELHAQGINLRLSGIAAHQHATDGLHVRRDTDDTRLNGGGGLDQGTDDLFCQRYAGRKGHGVHV